MLTIGFNAHHRLYAMCILGEDGAVVKEHTIRDGPAEATAWLGAMGKPMWVCYEASLGYGLLDDRLRAVGAPGQGRATRPLKQSGKFDDQVPGQRVDLRYIL